MITYYGWPVQGKPIFFHLFTFVLVSTYNQQIIKTHLMWLLTVIEESIVLIEVLAETASKVSIDFS